MRKFSTKNMPIVLRSKRNVPAVFNHREMKELFFSYLGAVSLLLKIFKYAAKAKPGDTLWKVLSSHTKTKNL